jgi:hypothetical protein
VADLRVFVIFWLDWNGHVIGRENVSKYNVDAAITYAANKIKRGRDGAFGFRVVSESLLD